MRVLAASMRALESPWSSAAAIHGPVLGERADEPDERRQPAAAGPRDPTVEQGDGVGGGQPEDLVQLLLEQIGPVEPAVSALDLRELGGLAAGEPLWVLPQ